MNSQVISALYDSISDQLREWSCVERYIYSLKGLSPQDAVGKLGYLVEAVIQSFAWEVLQERNQSTAKSVSNLTHCSFIPEEVSASLYLVLAKRNRASHPISLKTGDYRRVEWTELLSTLSAVYEITAWAICQKEWDAFVEGWSEAPSTKNRIVASNPTIDWLQPRIEPASAEDIQHIVNLDSAAFEPGDLVSPCVFRDWLQRDAKAFVCARLGRERVVGYYSLLFLKEEPLRALIDGNLREKNITAQHICDGELAKEQSSAYVYSVVIQRHYSPVTPLLFSHLVGRLRFYYEEGALRYVYSVAATVNGEKLLKERFKFSLFREGRERPDGHPLYMLGLDNSTSWELFAL